MLGGGTEKERGTVWNFKCGKHYPLGNCVIWLSYLHRPAFRPVFKRTAFQGIDFDTEHLVHIIYLLRFPASTFLPEPLFVKRIVCHVTDLQTRLLKGNLSHGRISRKCRRVPPSQNKLFSRRHFCFWVSSPVSFLVIYLLTADFRQSCLTSTSSLRCSRGWLVLPTWRTFIFHVLCVETIHSLFIFFQPQCCWCTAPHFIHLYS